MIRTSRRATLAFLLVLFSALAANAQTALRLQWELRGDVFSGTPERGASRAAFTLTNNDTKPLPPKGWAIYFNAMLGRTAGTEQGGIVIEPIQGDFYRMVPAPSFAGLAPGKTVVFEYSTNLIGNITQAPVGPYIVFDANPAKGYAIRDYTIVPFERPDQQGRAPRVITPEALYDRNAATKDLPLDELPLVLPTPLRVTHGNGTLRLTVAPRISAPPELAEEQSLAAAYFSRSLPGRGGLPITLSLALGPIYDQRSPDAYELRVDPGGVRIVGMSKTGVFYGLQTLRSLVAASPAAGDGAISVPAISIVDAPRFAYRGLMIDVARNFQPKATMFRVLDVMARYKMNVLHFHLTEDEGWRIEIPGLPELTSIGGRRCHTLDFSNCLTPAYGSGPDPDRPWGSGFYSTADYVEILKYAAARHIEVVPEIEMPGHARAAIKSMEARFRRLSAAGDAAGAKQYLLSDPDDKSVYTSAQGYHDNVMNPAQDSTYAFIDKVVEQLAAVHQSAGVPLRNLHLGGDEVPAGVWERSPIVQSYLQANKLTSVDELWFVFYGRIEQMLKRRGIALSGWEEVGARKTRLDGRPKLIPNPGFAARGWRAYVWNNVPGWGAEDLAYRMANGGYKVILAPVSNFYLDLAYNKNPEEPGLFWGGYVDVDKPFDFIPFDYYRNTKEDARGNPLDPSVFVGKDRLTDYGRDNIDGIQACLWSEALHEEGRLEYMLMPKLLGVAERAWAPEPDWARERDAAKSSALYAEAWSRFVNAVGKRELTRLDTEGLTLNYRIPTPGLKVVDGAVLANLQFPGFTLRYTVDGTEPTMRSAAVAGPIAAKGTIRMAAFDGRGRKSATARVENK